ncbi:MAG: T9SS type A sorting domain-containing protein [Bacteroidia bacterium]|nr:T9SS type A sorting domain-containing protein [Bacteroidia bacterium]
MKQITNYMLNKISIILLFIFCENQIQAQCITTNVPGDLIISSNIILSGTYNVSGTFKVLPFVTVYVKTYSSGGCGKLIINAQKISIEGTIDGNYAGYTGGTGGLGGNIVSSLTGDQTAINTCSNKDNTGIIIVEGGKYGNNGLGTGAGLKGQNGQNGSGPKQQCLSNDDECGMIGGAGGSGGGGGASYGGSGTTAANGGSGTSSYTATGVNVSTGYVVFSGNGGVGGNPGNVFGTDTGQDIDMGSGGAGGGGGGRSYDVGLAGGKGGNGGGLIQLIAIDTLKITGKILVNGEAGAAGGNAGNGGISPNCCSDGCDDSGEATLSCGAGAGSGGGGGSGGGIYLESQTIATITGILQSNGGNGGNSGIKGDGTTANYSGGVFCGNQTIISGNGAAGNKGGAAGGGRIKIFVPTCSSSTVTPNYTINGGTGYTNASNGSYQVMCGVTSINESIKEQFALRVFPNPFSENVTIQFKYDETPEFISEITVLNTLGMIIKTIASDELKYNRTIQIDLSELTSGIYFIKTTINNLSYDYKIIKQ